MKWRVLVNAERYFWKICTGIICIGVPHSKLWGFVPPVPTIYAHYNADVNQTAELWFLSTRSMEQFATSPSQQESVTAHTRAELMTAETPTPSSGTAAAFVTLAPRFLAYRPTPVLTSLDISWRPTPPLRRRTGNHGRTWPTARSAEVRPAFDTHRSHRGTRS